MLMSTIDVQNLFDDRVGWLRNPKQQKIKLQNKQTNEQREKNSY